MATIASPYAFSSMDGNVRLAAVLSLEVSLLLADRASLRGHEAIVDYGNIAGSGSETIRVPLLGLDGYDAMASTGEAYDMAVTTAICALFGSFSNSVGTATVDLSVDDFFSAIFQLEQSNVNGRPMAVLAPIQLSDLQNSIRQEGGALQFVPATQAMLEGCRH